MDYLSNKMVIEYSGNIELADQLGEILAQKSKLAAIEKEIKKELIARSKISDLKAIDGLNYRVTISHIESKKVNWKKIAEKFDVSRQLKRAYTQLSESDRVSCKSLLTN